MKAATTCFVCLSWLSVAAAEPVQPIARKSAAAATTLSVGGTLGGLAAAALIDDERNGARSYAATATAGVALVVGPSLGHIYAREYGHALRWSGYRFVSLGTLVGGLYLVQRHDEGYAFGAGLVLAGAGAGASLVTLYWDLFDAHNAAKRANRRSLPATLVPIVNERSRSLHLVWTF